MNNKEPTWFISTLRWAFSIILILMLFFLTFSFIYYSEISLDSKISSFFSFISTFGIAATIGVYFWQKKDNLSKIEKKINAINILIAGKCKRVNWLSYNTSKLIESIKKDNSRIKNHTNNNDNYCFIEITPSIKNRQYKFNIADHYRYKKKLIKPKGYTYTINSIDSNDLIAMLYESATIDINLHSRLVNLISIITDINYILDNIMAFNDIVMDSCGESFVENMYDIITENKNKLKMIYYECTGNELLHMDWVTR